jgi:anti-sigma regulatory factor (Ser/Thr protein kinase)
VSFSISAHTDEARRASTWLGKEGSERGIPTEHLWRLDVCVNETLANIIAHGAARVQSTPICLRLDVHRSAGGGEASVTISDAGTAFNPLTVVPPERPRTLSEAEPGGHGLTLLRYFADALDYRYSEGHNHLTIYVHWDEAS